MVRGLVEQQQVAREQDAGELDAPALATGQRGDRQVEAIGAEPETAQRCAGPPTRPRSRRACRNASSALPNARTLRADGSSSTFRCSASILRASALEARAHSTCASAVPSSPVPAGGGSCGQVAETFGAEHDPAAAGAAPAMTLSIDVLPTPLRPTSPTLSPACSEKEAPVDVYRPPTSTEIPHLEHR